eukprot:5811878-Pleurochrysis_carterae.AAC.1
MCACACVCVCACACARACVASDAPAAASSSARPRTGVVSSMCAARMSAVVIDVVVMKEAKRPNVASSAACDGSCSNTR